MAYLIRLRRIRYPAGAGLQNKKRLSVASKLAPTIFFYFVPRLVANAYIIPPMPAPAGIAGASSLIVATTDSVVRSVEATLVAF